MSVAPLTRPRRAAGSPPSDDGGSHPRMRARQAEVARGTRRRRLRRLNVVLALVCAVVWVLVGVRSSLVDVDRVTVTGAEQTSAPQVRAAAGIDPGDALVGLDIDGAQRAVADLPWIDEAQVVRDWPGTVRIEVTERVPVAAVALADTAAWVLVDRSGRALAEVTGPPRGLVALDDSRDVAVGGVLGEADRSILAVVAALPDSLRASAEAATSGRDGVELALEDGFQVVLGDRTDLAAKIDAIEAVRQHATPSPGRCRIDVRVPSAPVLTLGRGCA